MENLILVTPRIVGGVGKVAAGRNNALSEDLPLFKTECHHRPLAHDPHGNARVEARCRRAGLTRDQPNWAVAYNGIN